MSTLLLRTSNKAKGTFNRHNRFNKITPVLKACYLSMKWWTYLYEFLSRPKYVRGLRHTSNPGPYSKKFFHCFPITKISIEILAMIPWRHEKENIEIYQMYQNVSKCAQKTQNYMKTRCVTDQWADGLTDRVTYSVECRSKHLMVTAMHSRQVLSTSPIMSPWHSPSKMMFPSYLNGDMDFKEVREYGEGSN